MKSARKGEGALGATGQGVHVNTHPDRETTTNAELGVDHKPPAPIDANQRYLQASGGVTAPPGSSGAVANAPRGAGAQMAAAAGRRGSEDLSPSKRDLTCAPCRNLAEIGRRHDLYLHPANWQTDAVRLLQRVVQRR